MNIIKKMNGEGVFIEEDYNNEDKIARNWIYILSFIIIFGIGFLAYKFIKAIKNNNKKTNGYTQVSSYYTENQRINNSIDDDDIVLNLPH
jgi:heme/copper-type cytochrome/quinol oxidase subunit 3